MRLLPVLLLFAASAAPEPFHRFALLNVEVVDREGVSTELAGFYRISGEDRFQGFLGSGEIEVPYDRIREWRVMAPAHPGGRPRCRITLRSGKEVEATFDEREAEQLFIGFSRFGRVSLFFRDMRHLKILGKTRRADLPKYGRPAAAVDVKLTDRQGVATELVKFRRVAGENIVPGVRGAARIAIPMRLIRRIDMAPAPKSAFLDATAKLKDGTDLAFRVPVYEEETVYRGDAEFGAYRIRLGEVRVLEVRRITPVLRDLDPLAAAEGKEAQAPR